ncbi:MAG: hypothetical protein GY855_00420 [candidate division Zixibacteria bacterium]|nr:hypothetical protein [candidate division Zixibacteria bacterium]
MALISNHLCKLKYIRRPIIAIGLVVLCCLFISGCNHGIAIEKSSRPDIITLDYISSFGELVNPPVLFPHDLHTDYLTEQGKGCDDCHLYNDDNEISFKFLRFSGISRDSVELIYHNNCIPCHEEISKSGESAGPVECDYCHSENPKYTALSENLIFNKSLHHIHNDLLDSECNYCHHSYDSTQQKTEYIKGAESNCRDCHNETNEKTSLTLRDAAHQICLRCHEDMELSSPPGCASCHVKVRRAVWTEIDNPMRILTKQHDNALLSTGEKTSKANSVPFSHLNHEKYTGRCRDCHHESMNKCRNCHSNDTESSQSEISLQQSMHKSNSSKSCVGCHNRQKNTTECLGCHGVMEQSNLSKHSCVACHSGPDASISRFFKPEYYSFEYFKKGSKKPLSLKDAPVVVSIDVMTDKYLPVEFPHELMVNSLIEIDKQSNLANYFHGSDDKICQGCHHHSPTGEKPPKCINCHNEPFNTDNLHKPGLLGAYHQQCIGCHQRMNITLAVDCVECHALKN